MVLEMQEEAKWYIVHTYSGYENKVASNLEKTVENRGIQDLIQQVYVPTEQVTEIKDNKAKKVERKVFPGYVIVKMVLTDESWYIVRNIRGCTGFVGPSSKPIPLTDAEVERLGVETKSIEVPYNVGDSVEVTSGPLKGFSGVVKEIDKEKNTVKIVVSMFGRETVAELELEQVELAS
jgi:transcriptional antiterminator NusG